MIERNQSPALAILGNDPPKNSIHYATALRNDIRVVLHFIDDLRHQSRGSLSSCLGIVVAKARASVDAVRSIEHRYKEATVLLLKEMGLMSQHGSCKSDVLTLLTRPQHFQFANLKLDKSSRDGSAWSGSNYKITLITSLREKLLLKLVFYGWRHYDLGKHIL